MAWMLLIAAWWFNGMMPRPTRRQINQERAVRELEELMRAAKKECMVRVTSDLDERKDRSRFPPLPRK